MHAGCATITRSGDTCLLIDYDSAPMCAGLRQPLLDRVYVVRRGEQQWQQPAAIQGRYVLYWMRTAVRVHENPALDVAGVALFSSCKPCRRTALGPAGPNSAACAAFGESIAALQPSIGRCFSSDFFIITLCRHAAVHASHQLGLPLVVASFVLASHPFATARRVKFLLEGLRDVQEELRRLVSCLCVVVAREKGVDFSQNFLIGKKNPEPEGCLRRGQRIRVGTVLQFLWC